MLHFIKEFIRFERRAIVKGDLFSGSKAFFNGFDCLPRRAVIPAVGTDEIFMIQKNRPVQKSFNTRTLFILSIADGHLFGSHFEVDFFILNFNGKASQQSLNLRLIVFKIK